jgi:hypothetical protein
MQASFTRRELVQLFVLMLLCGVPLCTFVFSVVKVLVFSQLEFCESC